MRVCGDAYLIVEAVFLEFLASSLRSGRRFFFFFSRAKGEIFEDALTRGEKQRWKIASRTLCKKLTGACHANKFPDDLPNDEGADNDWMLSVLVTSCFRQKSEEISNSLEEHTIICFFVFACLLVCLFTARDCQHRIVVFFWFLLLLLVRVYFSCCARLGHHIHRLQIMEIFWQTDILSSCLFLIYYTSCNH